MYTLRPSANKLLAWVKRFMVRDVAASDVITSQPPQIALPTSLACRASKCNPGTTVDVSYILINTPCAGHHTLVALQPTSPVPSLGSVIPPSSSAPSAPTTLASNLSACCKVPAVSEMLYLTSNMLLQSEVWILQRCSLWVSQHGVHHCGFIPRPCMRIASAQGCSRCAFPGWRPHVFWVWQGCDDRVRRLLHQRRRAPTGPYTGQQKSSFLLYLL